jgi:hypothetical protein
LSSNNGKLTPETRKKIHYACGLILNSLPLSSNAYNALLRKTVVETFGDRNIESSIHHVLLDCGMNYEAAWSPVDPTVDLSKVYPPKSAEPYQSRIARGIDTHREVIAARLNGKR